MFRLFIYLLMFFQCFWNSFRFKPTNWRKKKLVLNMQIERGREGDRQKNASNGIMSFSLLMHSKSWVSLRNWSIFFIKMNLNVWNEKWMNTHDEQFLLILFILSNFLGNGVLHSLSWHRKGDRMTGCKLFARIWTPEDPRSNSKLFASKFNFSADQTQIWSQRSFRNPETKWIKHLPNETLFFLLVSTDLRILVTYAESVYLIE